MSVVVAIGGGTGEMGRRGRGEEEEKKEKEELREAQKGYKAAERVGSHEEMARWANMIGDIYKRRGEYVEALRWLGIDYDLSVKYLSWKQLLPTCQSLGEVYLRLDRLNEALTHQKKHLELAMDCDNLIEQQRANTQLGRTYHEIFLRSENDHTAIRNAKNYFKSAMKLAHILKEKFSSKKSAYFLREYIDSYNNIGMLEMDLDNFEEAEKILLQGLKICEEEEVKQNDDGRSRLHHNLGSLYIELREWSKAMEHIKRDIIICRNIFLLQGEAKGFINLGELHYRLQKYDDALQCYHKALDTAISLEDEDALVNQIKQNIDTVKEATKVLQVLQKDENKLKKLIRSTNRARKTSYERKFLLEQNTCLDNLIEKSAIIFAWSKHHEFAKIKKKVANELCDKEKLGDSFLYIGESYQKLRNFSKALKWYIKSWNVYRNIGNLEGQAVAKINIGEVLDSSGDWAAALEAFEEGYRIAVQGNLLSLQISALENMHYSHMIRFDDLEEARKVQHDIGKLKLLLKEDALCILDSKYCAETETEGVSPSDSSPVSLNNNGIATSKPSPAVFMEQFAEDIPLARLARQSNASLQVKSPQFDDPQRVKVSVPSYIGDASSNDLSRSKDEQHLIHHHKRARVVISDHKDNQTDVIGRSKRSYQSLTNDRDKRMLEPSRADEGRRDVSCRNPNKDIKSVCKLLHIEEGTCSTNKNNGDIGSSNDMKLAIVSKPAASYSRPNGDLDLHRFLPSQSFADSDPPANNSAILKFKVCEKLIYMDIRSCINAGYLNIESLKAEVACRYYLLLPEDKRLKGFLPVIGQFKCYGKVLQPFEPIGNILGLIFQNMWIEVSINGWVRKYLLTLYANRCKNLLEPTSLKLLQNLYNLEVSEDEVVVSDCELRDKSVSPFLDALEEHKYFAVLDVSHNLLGKDTMEKLQRIFSSSNQTYGGLTLDLHSNHFGPNAIFQICDCPIISARLEVLNLSYNRLTDACSSFLSAIIENCKALYSLNMEHCHITSRTIQKIADALNDGSVLSNLSIGKNSPISGNAMTNLLSKLGSLKRFSELSLTGIRLNKIMIHSLCQLANSTCLTSLMLGETYIKIDGAVSLCQALLSGPQELLRFDLSYCGLQSDDISNVCNNVSALGGILDLCLEGNFIQQEGCSALELLLMDPNCTLKCLNLNKCRLGMEGIISILKALADNKSLEEIHLAENADMAIQQTPIAQMKDATEIVNGTSESELMNIQSHELQVADNCDEDTGTGEQNVGFHLVEVLYDAVMSAKQLKLLNLSRNGLTNEVVEALYLAWQVPNSRWCNGEPRKHADKELVHLLVDGRRCCVKPCCRRDLSSYFA